jgi:hypothetical protein
MKLIDFGARNFAPVVLVCALGSALSSVSTPASAASTTLTISGTPATSVTLPNEYSFQPGAKETIQSQFVFGIYHKPGWATFDAKTGRLYGRPNSGDIGTYPNIVIRVADWHGSAALPPFSITVKAVPAPVADTAPTISGHASASATVGVAYTFTPSASDADHQTLTFSIRNKPTWATFNASSGRLSGTPTAANVGTYANIQIAVSDGIKSTVLSAFTVTVNSAAQAATANAMLDWTPPTENTDGTVLTDLAGYNVYYGTQPDNLSQVIKVANPGLTSYVVESLGSGTWYFSVTSVSAAGLESARSGVISTTIL